MNELTDNKIPETDSGQCDEGVVDGIRVLPTFVKMEGNGRYEHEETCKEDHG